VRGASIDWAGFHRDEKHRRIELPTYPFQRKRYWVEQPAQSQSLSQDNSPILAIQQNWHNDWQKQAVYQQNSKNYDLNYSIS